MQHYKTTVTFTFSGTVIINADSASEARETLQKNFGLVMGGRIEATDNYIRDWNFSSHPEKKISRITLKKKKS